MATPFLILGGLVLLLLAAYWLIYIAEGSYAGAWLVRWLYDRGARTYDDVGRGIGGRRSRDRARCCYRHGAFAAGAARYPLLHRLCCGRGCLAGNAGTGRAEAFSTSAGCPLGADTLPRRATSLCRCHFRSRHDAGSA